MENNSTEEISTPILENAQNTSFVNKLLNSTIFKIVIIFVVLVTIVITILFLYIYILVGIVETYLL